MGTVERLPVINGYEFRRYEYGLQKLNPFCCVCVCVCLCVCVCVLVCVYVCVVLCAPAVVVIMLANI